LAIKTIGCLTIPIYHTEELNTILHILHDSDSRLLFTYSQVLTKQTFEAPAQCPLLQKIILVEVHSKHADIIELNNCLLTKERIDRQQNQLNSKATEHLRAEAILAPGRFGNSRQLPVLQRLPRQDKEPVSRGLH